MPTSAPAGIYYGLVDIACPLTDGMSRLTIPWIVRVSAPLSIAPKRIRFLQDRNDRYESTIVVDMKHSHSTKELLVVPVPSELSSFAVKTTESGDGWIVTMSVSSSEYPKLEGLCFSVEGFGTTQVDLQK